MADPLQRPIGTRDFAPDEMAVRRRLEATMRSVFLRFGYREVATPAFEELALFTAKSGPGIVEELYDFKDKGDRHLTLRPELTAPAMRLYFQEHFNDPKPLKWFYHGPCYRYDRPQAGRYREFWQFGCEQIGAGTPLAYAELLALADAVVQQAGVRQREFHVGHVKVLKHCVDGFGFDAATRGALMRAIDKGNRDEVERLAAGKRGCEAALDRLFLVMDAPTVAAARHALLLDATSQDEADAELRKDLDDLEATLAHAQAFGLRDLKLNLGIARGLDYYTGIVFEMHCPALGAQKQLLGGGGYDLSGAFGGTPVPTMGFGLGFDRTIVALEAEAKQAGNVGGAFAPEPGPVVYFGTLSDAAVAKVLPVVSQLRAAGVAADLDLLGRKPGAVAKHADAVRARYLVIVGDRDLEAGAVQVKELSSGNARTVKLADLAKAFV